MYLRRVEKLSTSGGADDNKAELAKQRGINAHKDFAAYVSHASDNAGEFLVKIKPLVDELRVAYTEGQASVEQAWHFDADWSIVESGNWSATWHISVLDYYNKTLHNTADVVDLKTGKKYGNEIKHKLQLQLYAICVMMRDPHIDAVRARCFYADHPKEKPLEAIFTRNQLPGMLMVWNNRARTILNDFTWKPQATVSSCRYCPYGSMNGNSQCSYAAYTDQGDRPVTFGKIKRR